MIKWLKKKWCAKFGHDYESNPAGAVACKRCGHVLVESRNELLKQLLPGIEATFGIKYKKNGEEE
jgi:hypothetical protein